MTWSDDWLNEEWGTASRCVSHSESIAELGWVVLKLSVKSSEGWNLMCWSMMLHTNLDAHILVPHFSFLFILPSACLSLASRHLPSSTNIDPLGPLNEFRKMSHHSRIKLPTWASRDSISWGLGSITRSRRLALKIRLLCCPYSNWSSSRCHSDLLPW